MESRWEGRRWADYSEAVLILRRSDVTPIEGSLTWHRSFSVLPCKAHHAEQRLTQTDSHTTHNTQTTTHRPSHTHNTQTDSNTHRPSDTHNTQTDSHTQHKYTQTFSHTDHTHTDRLTYTQTFSHTHHTHTDRLLHTHKSVRAKCVLQILDVRGEKGKMYQRGVLHRSRPAPHSNLPATE